MEIRRFPCRICDNQIIIKQYSDRLTILHCIDGRENIGKAYTLFTWEVDVLGGLDRTIYRIIEEEYRNPVCMRPLYTRVFGEYFNPFYDLNNHLQVGRMHHFQYVEDNTYGEMCGGYIQCVCGIRFPIMKSLRAYSISEAVNGN